MAEGGRLRRGTWKEEGAMTTTQYGVMEKQARAKKTFKVLAKIVLKRVTGYDVPTARYLFRLTLPYGIKRLFRNLFYTTIIRFEYSRLRKYHSVNRGASRGCPKPSVEARPLQNHASVNNAIPKGGMLKVLLVTEKWQAGRRDSGPTDFGLRYWGSLEESGLATQEHVYVDEFFYQHGRLADVMILERCMLLKPDCVISVVYAPPHLIPKRETLRLIRKMGIPLVAILTDTVHPFATPGPFYQFTNALEFEYPFADLYVVCDTTTAHLKKTKKPSRYLCLPWTQDGRIFYDPKLDRDIDVSFVGNEGHPWRRAGIEALNESGIQVYTRDSLIREKQLDKGAYSSVTDYVNVLQRSRIVLNFPFAIFCGRPIFQFKWRPVEAAKCGAMLLEAESPDTRVWLDPFVDYVPYSSQADLVDKAKYYLGHETERAAIALNGHKKFQELYSSKHYWEAVFGELGLGRGAPVTIFADRLQNNGV
jgi:hypothetical protein